MALAPGDRAERHKGAFITLRDFHLAGGALALQCAAMNKMPEQGRMRPAAPEEQAQAQAPGETAPRRRVGLAVLKGLLALALLAVAFAGWRLMMATAPKHVPMPAREAAEPVRVATVKLVDVRPVWRLYGRAAAARSVVLRPAISGRVMEKMPGLREGAPVRKGDVLARLDDLMARAAVKEAEATRAEALARLKEARARLELETVARANAARQLEIALRDLERARKLSARGAISAAALDQKRLKATQARLALAQRKANIATAQARIAQLEAAAERARWALQRARRNLSDTIIRAPFSGHVADVSFEAGQQVGPADRLLRVVSDAPPEARFALSERRQGALLAAGERAVGRKVRIIWRTSRGEEHMPAVVTRVSPQVAPDKGTVTLHARPLDAAAARRLVPGAFIEVRMEGPLARSVALLPEAAMHDASRVYVVKDGRLAVRPVRLVGFIGDRAVVRGLKADERVVISRMAAPREGRKAKVLP